MMALDGLPLLIVCEQPCLSTQSTWKRTCFHAMRRAGCKPGQFFSENSAEAIMAKITKFYIPSSFQKKATKWIPQEQKGKLIQFDIAKRQSA